jgi:hypothetical protein
MVVGKRRWKVVYSTGTRSVRRNGQISPSRYLRVFCPSRDSHSLVGKFGVTRSPEIGRRSSRRLGVCEWKVPTKVRETPSGTGGEEHHFDGRGRDSELTLFTNFDRVCQCQCALKFMGLWIFRTFPLSPHNFVLSSRPQGSPVPQFSHPSPKT